MSSHPSSRNSGRVEAWNGGPSIIRAHLFWTLKISSNNPALQFPQTETQYSRIGLILALNKMMRWLTGRNFLMRARTATRFRSFFLRLPTSDYQDREGSISSPKKRSLKRESFCRVPVIMYFVFCGWAAIFGPCLRIRKIPLKLHLNISQIWSTSIESSIISK